MIFIKETCVHFNLNTNLIYLDRYANKSTYYLAILEILNKKISIQMLFTKKKDLKNCINKVFELYPLNIKDISSYTKKNYISLVEVFFQKNLGISSIVPLYGLDYKSKVNYSNNKLLLSLENSSYSFRYRSLDLKIEGSLYFSSTSFEASLYKPKPEFFPIKDNSIIDYKACSFYISFITNLACIYNKEIMVFCYNIMQYMYDKIKSEKEKFL